MSKAGHVLLIAPFADHMRRTRLAKIIPQFVERGYSVRSWGWAREEPPISGGPTTAPELPEEIILRGGGTDRRRIRSLYPVWMARVFWRCLCRPRREDELLYCLGWESAFPALLASLMVGGRILFDDADRFSLVVNFPSAIRRLVQALEEWTSRRVLVHVIPGWSRYDWTAESMFMLRNTPRAEDIDEALSLEVARPEADLVVYANGWLGDTRGAGVILEVLRRLEQSSLNVAFLVAGRVDSPAGHELVRHSLVDYRGEISQLEALSLYSVSDVVLTLYDPSIPINRYAESNKWGDCVACGVPFVVNSEVRTAKEYVDRGAAWAVPYADAAGLAALLETLPSGDRLREATLAVSEMRAQTPLFAERIDELLDRCRS